MNINEIRIVRRPLVLATPQDVDAMESRLWITFPNGYRDYVTMLGEGILGGCLVRIYPPWRIEAELNQWRRRIGKYWFWDEDRQLLPKDRALECIIIGDTVNGDELVFHPSNPNRLFMLPHESERVLIAGEDLFSAVEWMCSSGQLVEPFANRDFEPFDSRRRTKVDGVGSQVSDPEGESLDDIVDVAKQWAERHGFRKSAEEDLKEKMQPDREASLQYEAVVLEGTYPYKEGYLAVFSIMDKKSQLEVAAFAWHWRETTGGYTYIPNKANLKALGKSE